MSNLMALEKQIAQIQFDVCRDAMIHLLTGSAYAERQYYDFLFVHLFEDNINSWLWFHLKLASF